MNSRTRTNETFAVAAIAHTETGCACSIDIPTLLNISVNRVTPLKGWKDLRFVIGYLWSVVQPRPAVPLQVSTEPEAEAPKVPNMAVTQFVLQGEKCELTPKRNGKLARVL